MEDTNRLIVASRIQPWLLHQARSCSFAYLPSANREEYVLPMTDPSAHLLEFEPVYLPEEKALFTHKLELQHKSK